MGLGCEREGSGGCGRGLGSQTLRPHLFLDRFLDHFQDFDIFNNHVDVSKIMVKKTHHKLSLD